jgi:PAS domain S-box-containing protein
MKTSTKPNEQLYSKIFDYDPNGVLIINLENKKILSANPEAAKMHGYKQEDLIGLEINRIIAPISWHLFANFVELIREGGVFEVQAQHRRSDDSLLTVQWQAIPFKGNGKTRSLVIISDVSKRVNAEYLSEQTALFRTNEQSTLLEISRLLASTLELKPVLILDQIRVLIKYSHAALYTMEESSMVALSARGTEKMEKLVPFRFHVDSSQTAETLINEYYPIRIPDLWNNEPPAIFMRTLLEHDSAPLLDGMQSGMWVPLVVEDRIIGGIGLTHVERNFFTLHDAELAMTIANVAAVTMVNAELYRNAQSLAALQERQRLAQNLHDAVNQSLFSAGLIAEVLPRLWERDQEEARRSLEDLRRLTRGAQAEMRALLVELRPTTLTDADLGELLRLLGNAFAGRTNIPVSVTITGEGKAHAEIQVALYRMCEEALNNIAKHANAGHVDLKMNVKPKSVDLYIDDDGCGFVTSKPVPSAHFGLGMMRERAESIGAKLIISSRPGKGTKVAIHWQEKEKR